VPSFASFIAKEAPNCEKVTEYFLVGTWRNVVIVLWRVSTLPEDVAFTSDLLARLAKMHPEGVGLFQSVEDTCLERPSGPTKEAIARLLRDGRSYIKASTVLFNGQGFRAAVVRAVATGLISLTRPGFPHQAHTSIEEAARVHAEHLVPRSVHDAFAAGVERAVRHLREIKPG
jgi:hypothetical protein